VGEMGYGTAVSITAVGDSVKHGEAHRSQTYACALVISEAVMLRHRSRCRPLPHEIEIRRRVERLVCTFTSARAGGS
jgi:hypothetical protein